MQIFQFKRFVHLCTSSRKLFSLRKNKLTGEWSRNELCMGDGQLCSGDLVGESRKNFILSFGEDEDGELYILATSDINPTTGGGVVYQIIDPSRCVLSNKKETSLIQTPLDN